MAAKGRSDVSSDAFDETADAGTGATAAALCAGTQLGKYRLDRVLGEGGMGVVWAAHDPDLERAVAIKVLRYAQATAQLRQRLLREARAMAKLKHPNVLTVYEVGTVGDRDYIAMELVEGQSLDTWLDHATYDERFDAIIAAGRGLAAAHAAGVVHRDFKPHNILRSRDGRVLVTDFGLARGLVADEEPPAFAPTRSGDALLDTPMTQTGALIGTPAYMAPEQYRGASPDPRTDQFAFCVTAWQALTGDRPFKGATLEEMKKSVGGGVAHLQTKLPGAVRVVLARGLDPEPGNRYAALEDLLDALERAARLPERRKQIMIAGFGIVMAIVLVVTLRDKRQVTAPNECEHPDRLFAQAWKRDSALGPIAEAFDQFGKRWVDAYTQACRAAPRVRAARATCLQGALDDVAALSVMLRNAAPAMLEQFDAPGLLPNLRACEGSSPLPPLVVPREQPFRDRAIAVLAQLLALRATTTPDLAETLKKLEIQATFAAGKAFAGTVVVTGANEYLRRGKLAEARALFDRFLKMPAPRNPKLEAIARVGLVDASINELVQPRARMPQDALDPRAKPTLHPELANLLAAARSAAGSDDVLAGAVALLEARARLHLGQWNRYRQAYSDALEAAARARKHFDAIGDVRRSTFALADSALIMLERGDERSLDDALFAARQAGDALEQANMENPTIDEIRARIAFLRRDFTEAHRRFDLLSSRLEPATTRTIKGRVVGGPPGRSVTVVAWKGLLVGDRARVFTDPRTVAGDIVQAAQDGTFTIHAEPDWAIIAEAKGMRAKPIRVGESPTLSLVATTTVSGSVTGKNLSGVCAFARYTVGSAQFMVRAPIDRDDTFDLVGLLPGPMQLGVNGATGDGERAVTASEASKLAWPSGQAIEAIVHAAADVVVLRGKHGPANRAELDALIHAATDVASCSTVPIGADNTDAGRDVYSAGDQHCVITGNADGLVTVCATTADRMSCQVVTLTPSVEVSYPDGRYATDVTPVVLQL